MKELLTATTPPLDPCGYPPAALRTKPINRWYDYAFWMVLAGVVATMYVLESR